MKANTAKRRGTHFELRIRRLLEEEGWWVFRSAGSRGAVDLIAIRAGEVQLIQCKVSGAIKEVERVVLGGLTTELLLPIYVVSRVIRRLRWQLVTPEGNLVDIERKERPPCTTTRSYTK